MFKNSGMGGRAIGLALAGLTTTQSLMPIALIALGATVATVGCAKKKAPPPPPPPPPPPAPPAPEPVKVDGLLQTMKSDARVQFPQANAPTDEKLARAVIDLADSLARGDSKKFEGLIDAPAKQVLSELLASGAWEESTGKKVEAVRVAQLNSSGEVVLAIQEVGSAYPLKWKATVGGPTIVFSAVATANLVLARASDFDHASLSLASARAASATDKSDERDAAPSEQEKPEAPPADSGQPAPRKRSTPNGPVTIPNPGGRN